MSYPRRLLNEGEDVVVELRPHWVFLSGPLLVTAAVVAATVATVTQVDNVPAWAVVTLVGVIALSALWLAQRYVRWAATSVVLTTDRLVVREGIVVRHNREIPLDRIDDITSRQSLLQRLIGSGSLLIESGGERGQEALVGLAHPEELSSAIHRQRSLALVRRHQPTLAGATPSIPEQIEQLEALCRRGIISRAEFDDKKAELLERM